MKPAHPPCRLLAISGSLRARSVNTAVLRAAARLASRDTDVVLFDGLGQLPHFNPDLDGPEVPAAVAEFRRQVSGAAGLLICSPEYAHGIPGSLKNALDWLVSYEPFIDKPVGLVNARPHASLALAALRETLGAMNARIIDDACVTLPLDSNRHDEETLLAHPQVVELVRGALEALARAADQRQADQRPA